MIRKRKKGISRACEARIVKLVMIKRNIVVQVQVQSKKRRERKRWKLVATVMVAVMVGVVGVGMWRRLVGS